MEDTQPGENSLPNDDREEGSRVEMRVTGQQTVIEATGEVSGQTLGWLQTRLQDALAHPARALTLDLRRATHIDDKGLSLIHRTGQQMLGSGRTLTVHVLANSQPARVLDLSQMEQLLRLLSGRSLPTPIAVVHSPAGAMLPPQDE